MKIVPQNVTDLQNVGLSLEGSETSDLRGNRILAIPKSKWKMSNPTDMAVYFSVFLYLQDRERYRSSSSNNKWSVSKKDRSRGECRTPMSSFRPSGVERAKFTGLVLRCIEANSCNQMFVGKLSPRSTQCTPLHRSSNSKFQPKIANIFRDWILIFWFFHFSRRILHFFWEILMNFFRISRQTPEKSEVCRFSINFAKTN